MTSSERRIASLGGIVTAITVIFIYAGSDKRIKAETGNSTVAEYFSIKLYAIHSRLAAMSITLDDVALMKMLDFLPEVTLSRTVLAVVCSLVCYGVYWVSFVPYVRVKGLTDVGYVTDDGRTVKEVANAVRRSRKLGEIPPVYPNGWFAVVSSRDVQKGESRSIQVLGLHIAVFRDDSGTVYALDAYCPHMGANMGVGGRVFGDCIECPFHGWRFRGEDGKCTHIPYAEKVPEIAKVTSYTVLEINETVYLWYHAEGRDPTWTPPELTDITQGTWLYGGRLEHYVNAHIQEIPENGADSAHLNQLHSPAIMSGTHIRKMHDSLWNLIQSRWTANWTANSEPDSHIATIQLVHTLRVFGKSIPQIDFHVTIQQIGPGIVYLEFESIFARGIYVQHVVPVEPMIQRITNTIYTHWLTPQIFAKITLLTEALQIERDIMIWNNKTFIKRPLLVKSIEDESIAKFRRWYSQFYSENSTKLTFQKDGLDW